MGAFEHIDRMANIALRIERCEGKRAFKKRGQAIIAAHYHSVRVQPYRCVICGHWHLTSHTGPVEEF